MNREQEYLKKNAFQRVSRLIESDKSEMSEECRQMALRDFMRVAKEYFDLNAPLKMEMEKEGGEYKIRLIFTADRIKTFFALK